MYIKAVFFVLGLLLWPGSQRADAFAAVDAPVTVPRGEARATTVDDLRPHPLSTNTYNEFWSYHFLLDEVQIYLNFSRANLSPVRDPVCGADMSVVGLQGKNYHVAREYPVDYFSFDRSQQKLQVHPNIWFRGDLPRRQEVHFETRKDGVSYYAHLTLTDIKPGVAWGNGEFQMGPDEKVGIFIHIPYARVTGVVAINGDTTQVNGTAYMDHTYQSAVGPRLVSGGLRYVKHDGDIEVGYILSPDSSFEKRPIGYGLKYRSGRAELQKPVLFETPARSRVDGADVIQTAIIAFEGGNRLTIERRRDRQVLATFRELSGIKRRLARMFLGGEIVYVRGVGRLNGVAAVEYNQLVIK